MISAHPGIDADFIIRDKYTPTLSNDRSTLQSGTDIERIFYSNIYETDYTLCLRGYGNWSYRLYETLACGRMPVFIDTDCVLPSVPNVDWKEYCVWIDKSELQYIGEKILHFHSSMSSADFVDRQRGCRELWEKHLTLDGFMADARAHFADLL